MLPRLDQPAKLETAVSDGKSDDVARQPASPSSHASQRDRECIGANEVRSPNGHKARQSKETKGDSSPGSSSDRTADKKALPTTAEVNKEAHAERADVRAKSSIETKQTGTKMRERSSNMWSSSDDATHDLASLAAASSGRGATDREEEPEFSKWSDGVAQETTPAAREPHTLEFSPRAVHTGSTGTNVTKKASQTSRAGVEADAGFPVSNSQPTRPVGTPQCGTSYVQVDSAADATLNRRGNYGTAQQGSPTRHSDVPVASVTAPTWPKRSVDKPVPSTPPTTTPRSSAIPLGRYPTSSETAQVSPEPVRESSESDGHAPWRGRIMEIIKSESVGGTGTTNSVKRAPASAHVKSRYSGTADYQVTLNRLRMGLFSNDRDEPSGPSRARRILILVPLAVLIVALVVVLLMRRSRVLHKLNYVSEHEVSGVCSNEECRRVVAFAAENTDLGFDPCVDFHRHACGRWFAGSTARRSYVDENRLNFSAAAHVALTQLLRRAQPGTVDRPRDVGMARFYSSCLAYAQKRPRTDAQALLERMGLNKSLWTDFASMQQLIDHVVAANLRTGLTGLVRVSKGENVANGHLVLDIGESLQSTLGEHATSFINVILRELDWPKNSSVIAALHDLDARVEIARNKDDTLPLNTTNAGENAATPSLGMSWENIMEDALEHAYSPSNESTNVKNAVVSIGVVDALRRIITALTTTDLRVAGIYSLLLMLAQVMKYPYLLATNYAGFEDITLCLQATGEHMSVQFASWLARSLEVRATSAYLENMVAALNQGIETSTWLKESFALNIADFQQKMMVKTAGSVITEGCVTRSTATRKKASYSDDFVANILLARKTAAPTCVSAEAAAAVRWQLEGRIESDLAGVLVAPTASLTPDLLHADAGEPSLDYSTLGVMLLIEWAHTVSARKPELSVRLSEYGQCVRTDAMGLLIADNVSDASLRTMVFLPWALDLALAAATSQWRKANRRDRNEDLPVDEDAATERLRLQLFFRPLLPDHLRG
ncbi:hypothetical protein MTO96_007319 [Rhipicephalus appendiculatus]